MGASVSIWCVWLVARWAIRRGILLGPSLWCHDAVRSGFRTWAVIQSPVGGLATGQTGNFEARVRLWARKKEGRGSSLASRVSAPRVNPALTHLTSRNSVGSCQRMHAVSVPNIWTRRLARPFPTARDPRRPRARVKESPLPRHCCQGRRVVPPRAWPARVPSRAPPTVSPTEPTVSVPPQAMNMTAAAAPATRAAHARR